MLTEDLISKQNYSQQLQLKTKIITNGENKKLNLKDYLNNKQVVYFIGDRNLQYVKIGITTSIHTLSKRFRSIQSTCPLKLKLHGFIQTNNANKDEKLLHQQFAKYKLIPESKSHEWFWYTPEIVRYVETNCLKLDLANTVIGEEYITLDDMGF